MMHAVLFLLTIALTLFFLDDKATKTGFEKQPAPQSKVMKVREHSPASLMQKSSKLMRFVNPAQ